MYSWEGLSFITSAAEHPVRLHPETASCSNVKIAKIFVNAYLSKELPQKIIFTKNGTSSLVEFIYPWLPVRCNTCGKWGHIEKVCVMNKKDETFKSVKEIIEHGLKEKETGKGAYPQEDRGEQTEVMEAIAQSNTEEEVEEGEVIEWWLNVSPGKTSRSPKTKALQYGQVKIASRYSALENADDNGDLAKYIEEKESEIIKEAEQKDNEKVKETEEKDNEMVKETEKKDSEEAKEIEEKENEVIKETEKKKNEVIKEKEKKDRDVALAAEIDGNAIEVDVSITGTPKTGNNEHESRRGTVTTNEIGKHEGKDTEARQGENQCKGSVVGSNSILRPSLPRNSKTNHKIVPGKDTENHGTQGRHNNRKSSQ